MDNYYLHQELIKKTKVSLTKSFPKTMRVFDRHIGLFFKKRTGGNMIDYIPIKIGKNGQCDVWGVVSAFSYANGPEIILPIHCEFEFKTGNGVLSEDQVIWKEFCESMGWLYFLVRENTDVKKEIENKIHSMGLRLWSN